MACIDDKHLFPVCETMAIIVQIIYLKMHSNSRLSCSRKESFVFWQRNFRKLYNYIDHIRFKTDQLIHIAFGVQGKSHTHRPAEFLVHSRNFNNIQSGFSGMYVRCLSLNCRFPTSKKNNSSFCFFCFVLKTDSRIDS